MKFLFQRGNRSRQAFTLMELSVAMGLMLLLGGVLLVMLQQHLSFMMMARRQAFLAQEAPQIGNLLGRIFQQADHYFIYQNRDSALAHDKPVIYNGGAVRLFFRTAVQTTRECLIAAEDGIGGTSLHFYNSLPDGMASSWQICRGLKSAVFNADEGILTVKLTGPNGEEITYCGGGR